MTTNNNDTNTIMQQLLNSIRKPLLFFIPSQLLDQLENTNYSGLKVTRIIDSIVILNVDDSIRHIDNNLYQIKLLEKEKILQNNIFLLLQQKALLNDKAFEFLLDSYSKELLAWVDYTKIMIEYLQEDSNSKTLDNYYPELLPFFELQHNCLQQHKKTYFAKFTKTLKELDFVGLNNSNNKSFFVAKHKSPNQQKTDLLIREEEADNYLLQYVFNIEII